MHTKIDTTLHKTTKTLMTALLFAAGTTWAQQTAPVTTASADAAGEENEELVVLSPFEVSAEEDRGYSAATTLAGNRLNTELRDIGNAVTVITAQFLNDIGATNNETLLQYTAGTEVGSIRGNFAGLGDGALLNEADRFTRPNQNTRVRGLAAADNTRDYFLSEIPWDSYNVDRVDLQRGPNSILFGLGSPAGLLNVGLKQAAFRDSNEVGVRVDNWGTLRLTASINKVIIPKELAIRIDTLYNKEKFQQKPAYSDDRRTYAALRYEPGFLKKGSARTIFKASFENGNIASNRPRSLPPLDRITPWFYSGTYTGSYKGTGTAIINGVSTPVVNGAPRTYNYLNRETFNPFQMQDDNTGRPNHGMVRPVLNGGPDAGKFNPGYNPWVGNFANQFSGIDSFYVDGNANTPGSNIVWEDYKVRGINSLGAIDGGIGGRAFQRPGGVATYDAFATNAGLPYWQFGLYKAVSLTDESVFDFYNNLIDGPNKDEWNDWNATNLSLAQTFMDDKFGFEANYAYEDFQRGQLALLTGSQQAIFIDTNNVYNDGTPLGKDGEPFDDGTPNPNVGRPFISDSGQGGNNNFTSQREALRLTGFFTHDFNKNGVKNLLTRILGKHTITGLYSEDEQETDNRSWARYSALDNDYLNFIGRNNFRFNASDVSVNRIIYLGESLINKNTASGAHIPRVQAKVTVPSQVSVRAFDSTWVATNVNPADYWANNYYPNIAPFNLFDNPATTANERGSYNSWQSENPANYRGFVNTPIDIIDSESDPKYRNLLTTAAQRTRSEVKSKALVWQSYFWDKSIIGTVGYREDNAKSWGRSLTSGNTAVPGYLDLNKNGGYAFPVNPVNTIKAISRSYSIVAHLNQLPFLSRAMERLPVELTFFYNQSSNFQPSASRVDVYGIPLPPPAGKTIDRGVLIESKDGKYSLKINKFITTLTNASSSALGNSGFIGTSQQYGGNWANQFEYDLGIDNQAYIISHQVNNRPPGSPNPPGYTSVFIPGNPTYDATNTLYNYGTDIGETADQAAAREQRAVAGWRAWQKQVDPRFYAAWGINLNDLTKPIAAAQPQGFTVTEDSSSEGYEIEFNANPTRNWRLTFNATQVEAIRSNVGGTNLREFITAYETALRTTAAGDIRVWWGGAGNDTTFRQWFNGVGSDWAQKSLSEGTKAAELREWRFNMISNYNFSEGRLKGFNVGGGVRWQGKNSIGNRPVGDPYGSKIAFDLSNPYYGPSETNFDLWTGYSRRLNRKFFSQNIDWSIQLNVTNVGQGNELIPVTVQPDGTPATYRIAPHQYFTLTNTFKF
jgi:hypothetical protein